MSSEEEDIEDLALFSTKQSIQRNLRKCKKCDEISTSLLQKKDPFCRECFFQYCDHKFRSTIGKAKKIKPGDKVLLACSGGRKSAALLHMTNQALKSSSAKQVSFIPGVVFIDESAVAPPLLEDNEHQVEEIVEELKEYGYPILISSLEMSGRWNEEQIYIDASYNCDLRETLKVSPEVQSDLKKCIASLQNLSAKIGFIKRLRMLLITEIASRAGYDYVFLGDSSTSLAVNLLSDLALGRGSQISCDTSFYDTRYSVPVCRPIREFLNKELALYNVFHDCSFRVLPDLTTKTDDKSSVQRLTESFITNLQNEFPATVSTIFRTGGKLTKFGSSTENRTCVLCKSKLDNLNPEPCSALEALKISEKLSHSTCSSSGACNDENFVGCADDNPFNDYIDSDEYNVRGRPFDFFQYDYRTLYRNTYCHGCSIPFRHKKDSDFFPLHPEVRRVKMERHQMKNMIDDVLIEDKEPS